MKNHYLTIAALTLLAITPASAIADYNEQSITPTQVTCSIAPTPTPTPCSSPTESQEVVAPIATQAAIVITPTITEIPTASSAASPTPIIAQIQPANETNTSPSTSSNNSPTASGNSSSAPSGQTSTSPSPTTLPNTGDSIELLGTLLLGISSLAISFLLKKITA